MVVAGASSVGTAAATTLGGGNVAEDVGVSSGMCRTVSTYQIAIAISRPVGNRRVRSEPARKLSAKGIGGMVRSVLLRS